MCGEGGIHTLFEASSTQDAHERWGRQKLVVTRACQQSVLSIALPPAFNQLEPHNYPEPTDLTHL